MALASSLLPGVIHSDPADLLLIATALEMNIPIATRDRKILAYADAGHVQAIAC
jgi:PIN domain nuclease of toxin-antitoxin system